MNMKQKFAEANFSAEALQAQLAGTSPMQASRILISAELYEQRSSLDVLNSIYADFETKENVIDELVTPLALNVLDGIISHRKLKLNRTGVTASRLWSEIKTFEYSTPAISGATLSAKQQLEAMRQPRAYDKKVRATMTKRRNLTANKDRHFRGNSQSYSSIELNEDGSHVTLYRYQQTAKAKGRKSRAADSDHIVSVKQINDQYAKNCFLTDTDISAITDGDHNLAAMSNRLNRAKGAGTFAEMLAEKRALQAKQSGGTLTKQEKRKLDNLSLHTDKTLENGVRTEERARMDVLANAQKAALGNVKNNKSEIAKKAGGQSAEQTAYQAIGQSIIEFIKPLFHELSDSIRNGFYEGVGATTVVEGLKLRFARLMKYLRHQVIPTLAASIRDFCTNFLKILIEGVLGLVIGIFKTIMRVVSEGFSALVSALKVLRTPEMSGAEKADAISKIFASTVTTFVVFYFQEHIGKLIPNGFLKDIAFVILSGVASTLVVYLLDQVDLFSTSAIKRSRVVKEIFEERVRQIKEAAASFEAVSVSALAAQKLRFRQLSEQLDRRIEAVNDTVLDVAEWAGLELEIKDTETFLELLQRSEVLTV